MDFQLRYSVNMGVFGAHIQPLNAPMEQKKQYAAYNRRLLRTKYSASAMANKYMKLFRKLISAE